MAKQWKGCTDVVRSPRGDEAEGPACGLSVELPTVAEALRPLESRMKSAESYFAPRDIEEEEEPKGEEADPGDDGLGHHGDPEGPVILAQDENPHSPVVVRAPREPIQKEREAHEAGDGRALDRGRR